MREREIKRDMEKGRDGEGACACEGTNEVAISAAKGEMLFTMS